MRFPEGRKVKKGKVLPVVVETTKPFARLRFCFKDRKEKNFCTLVEVKRDNYLPKKRRIPITVPKVHYEELK